MDEGENFKVRDLSLASQGRKMIEWAEAHMPVLMGLRKEYADKKPLEGMRIAGALHVTKETAVLVRTLVAAGANLAWAGCNPLSTNDAVAAALAEEGISIYAWHGLSTEEFYWALDKVLEIKPTLTLDDGADLIFRLHDKHPDLLSNVIGGTEETTTGVIRLRAMHKEGALKYPVIAVNDTPTKWQFDNVYGTGQSALDGVLRATNVLLAGKQLVVAGYGHCGRGIAMRAKGMGARVIVTEVDPVNALKAALEGYSVMPMDKASEIGDIFITATGMKDVIRKRHFEKMKDGAIIANAGHFDVEINVKELEEIATSQREIRPNNEEFVLPSGNRVYLLARGRLVNLVAAEGHPSEVMDMSFANQFLALVRLAQSEEKLSPGVYLIDHEIDRMIAMRKLETMGFDIDELTPEQIKYLESYQEGT